MKTVHKIKITEKNETLLCTKCRIEANLPVWEYINSAEMPELRERVLNNLLPDSICNKCGENIDFTDLPLLYHDPINEFAIHYFPNPTEEDINELNSAATNFPYEKLRIVFEYEDLLDKIQTFEANLNDKVMEICKAVIIRIFSEKLNIPGYFTFYGFSDDRNYLIFHNTLAPDEEGLFDKKPIEGSILMNIPLWQSIYNEDKKPITGGIYIKMSKDIYNAVENERCFDCKLTKGKWDIVDIHYAVGQVFGESTESATV